MEHAEFRIGVEFQVGGDRVFRCTDVGTRTIAAIRVDSVEISSLDTSSGERSTRTLTREEAEQENCFDGPPYMVAEHIFDEYDFEGCEPCVDVVAA